MRHLCVSDIFKVGLKALGGEAGREPKASNGSEDPPYNDLVKSVEGGSDVEN